MDFQCTIARRGEQFTVTVTDDDIVRDFKWFNTEDDAMKFVSVVMNRACYVTEQHD